MLDRTPPTYKNFDLNRLFFHIGRMVELYPFAITKKLQFENNSDFELARQTFEEFARESREYNSIERGKKLIWDAVENSEKHPTDAPQSGWPSISEEALYIILRHLGLRSQYITFDPLRSGEPIQKSIILKAIVTDFDILIRVSNWENLKGSPKRKDITFSMWAIKDEFSKRVIHEIDVFNF